MQRSLRLFQNSVGSEITAKQYKWYIDRFIQFYKLRDCDSALTIDQKQVQIMVEDYTMDLKKKVNPNSVPSYIYPILTFFEVNGIELKSKKIKRLFPTEIKKAGRKAYTTNDIKKMLEHTPDLRNKCIVLFMASTGCRIGALSELKIRNLSNVPNDCKAVKIHEDSIEEYFTFLTSEVSEILQRYFAKRKSDGEYIDDNSPIFRRKYRLGIEKIRPMTTHAIQSVVLRSLKKAGLRTEKKNGRYEIPLDHGFRKRFTTILKSNKDIPVAYAERLAGHKVYIDDRGNKIQLDGAYLTPELSSLFEEFKKAIPELMISDSERMRIENELRDKELEELRTDKKRIAELERNMANIREHLERMKKED